MAGEKSKAGMVPVVTLRTVLGANAPQTAGLEAAINPKNKKIRERYENVVEKIREETAKCGPNVLITVRDRDASRLQTAMAEDGEAGEVLAAGGVEAKFGTGATGGDLLGWAGSWFDHIDKTKWHAIVRPPDGVIETLPDVGRIAMLSDWGTNLYGAPRSADSIIGTGGYELLMHLGDIYYSGTKKESKNRFLDVWPAIKSNKAAKASRALNGNHEMYSGGYAYFDDILPKFKQSSSYFAMQNANWLLIGLDTAHTDHAIDDPQAKWVKAMVQNAGSRKVILFSHHQLFSRLSDQGPALRAALADLLQDKKITAWYWGHEHECIIYDKHSNFGLLARCVGHGGIPEPRKSKVLDAPTDRSLHNIAWKRLSKNSNAPSSLVLDGSNPLIQGEEEKFGPHGYVTLEFNGPSLVERVHLPDGTEIFKGPVT